MLRSVFVSRSNAIFFYHIELFDVRMTIRVSGPASYFCVIASRKCLSGILYVYCVRQRRPVMILVILG